jgi:hypothetical protein
MHDLRVLLRHRVAVSRSLGESVERSAPTVLSASPGALWDDCRVARAWAVWDRTHSDVTVAYREETRARFGSPERLSVDSAREEAPHELTHPAPGRDGEVSGVERVSRSQFRLGVSLRNRFARCEKRWGRRYSEGQRHDKKGVRDLCPSIGKGGEAGERSMGAQKSAPPRD